MGTRLNHLIEAIYNKHQLSMIKSKISKDITDIQLKNDFLRVMKASLILPMHVVLMEEYVSRVIRNPALRQLLAERAQGRF